MAVTTATLCFISSIIALCSGVEYVHFLSDEYIQQLNNDNLTWQAGRNYPADLTQADVRRFFGTPPLLGVLPESPSQGERRVTHEDNYGDLSIPNEFDARKEFKECTSLISVIPDQGACGSSYAFAIPSVAADRLCIASKGNVKRLLSAEYVTSCCKMCRYPDRTKLCDSGLSSSTWAWIHKRGLVTGGGYKSNIGCQPVSFPPCNHSPQPNSLPPCKNQQVPHPKCHTRCTNENYSRGFFQDKNKFKVFYWLSEQVPDIQREIIKYGPVAANIYLYSDLLSYKSGVYTVSPRSTIVAYAAVKIIGWGEESGVPYWLVVSTFGEKWGLGGTFKIRRGRNEAIIETLVSASNPRGNFNSELNSSGVEIDNGDSTELDDGFEFIEDSQDL